MNKKVLIITGSSLLVLGVATWLLTRKDSDSNSSNSSSAQKDDQLKKDIGQVINVSKEEGYTHVRKTPEVDKGFMGKYGFGFETWGSNEIGEVESNPLGTIINAVRKSDGIWYEVELNTPIDGQSKGWVRQDVVSFN